MNNKFMKRKNPRLKGYNYSLPNAYFITICTHKRENILSTIVGAIHESPLQSRSVVSKVVGYIKMNSSKEIHKHFGDITVWQRGFHDHIIRNKNDYDKIAKYISENPLRWELDCFFNQDLKTD